MQGHKQIFFVCGSKTYHIFTAVQAWLGLPTTNDLWKS